ncbi:unnamed protein product, partial [Porites lobata]
QDLLQSSFNLCPPVVRLHLGYCFKEELTNEELEIQHVKFAAFGFIHVPDLLASGIHSFKDCDANQKKEYCRSTSTCFKMRFSTTTGGEAYLKGCAPSPCRGTGDCSKSNIKCELSCCSSDYCNGASGPVVNAVILLIASFTSSFRYLF